jgi:hypothetical protein
MDFDQMTKLELEAYGREHGIELDRRLKKATLIEQLGAHRDAEPQTVAAVRFAADAMAEEIGPVAITITQSRESPVRVAVNGRWLTFPIGKPITVPAFVLPVLDAAGISYSKD